MGSHVRALQTNGPACLPLPANVGCLLVRLGHHCLLRLGDMLKLVVGDIRLPNLRAGSSLDKLEVAIIRLRDPKNKAALGCFQFPLVKDVRLCAG